MHLEAAQLPISVAELDRWRAVDEHGAVLGVFPPRHRDSDAARSFLERLPGEHGLPDTVCPDKLASYGAAIRELPAREHC